MAVRDVRLNSSGTSETWPDLRTDWEGTRLIVVVGDRAGGVSATAGTNHDGFPDFGPAVAEVVMVDDMSTRRSLWVFEAIVPPMAAPNPILETVVLDENDDPVLHARVAFVMDEADGWHLAGTATATSGSSDTTSQETGDTDVIPAGDHLIVAAMTSRGGADIEWDETTRDPDNPDDGTWDLYVQQSGNVNNARAAGAGYAVFPGESARSWSDVLDLDPARMVSAAIVVFTTGEPGDPVPEVTADFPLELTIDAVTEAPELDPVPEVTAEIPLTVDVDAATRTDHLATTTIDLDLDFVPATTAGHDATAEIPLALILNPVTEHPEIDPVAQVTTTFPLLLGLAPSTDTQHEATTSVPLELDHAPVTATRHDVATTVALTVGLTASVTDPSIEPPKVVILAAGRVGADAAAGAHILIVDAEARHDTTNNANGST